jgi:3D (Asp-Asp-Asp) domain-containing protein
LGRVVEKRLVITDGAFDYRHACQAAIGGAVFRQENGSWKLVAFQPNIISLGSFGYVPKGTLIQIGPDKHAALIRSGWAGQGYEGEYATIIADQWKSSGCIEPSCEREAREFCKERYGISGMGI